MADDEFVIGFTDSEWTGIAPMLEEDVAMSSLAQDELGHARALYQLLAELRDDGRDADAIAYDRAPDEYRHARLLDHGRGDWAMTIARRFLYDTADAARLEALGDQLLRAARASWSTKIRREERYHLMHVDDVDRAACGAAKASRATGSSRRSTSSARDAATVFTPLDGEAALVEAGVLAAPMAEPRPLAGADRPRRSCASGCRCRPRTTRPTAGRATASRSAGCGASSRWSAATTVATW